MVDQEVDLDQFRGQVPGRLVVEARVSLGPALQLIEEADHHLGEGDGVDELDPFRREVLHLHQLGAPSLAQVHHRARVLGGSEDRRSEDRLVDVVEQARLGELARVVHVDLGAVGEIRAVGHGRRRRDERDVEFPFEPFADDLHVQQAEESTPEPEAERT